MAGGFFLESRQVGLHADRLGRRAGPRADGSAGAGAVIMAIQKPLRAERIL